jgi:5'-deoxynucleotidase YfbR-like HD superfamily hydrolase
MQETAHSLRHAVDLTFDLSKLRTPVATDWQGPYSVPESRAERLFRAAHIALSLAVQEKMDSPTEAILPLLFRGLDQVTPSVYKVTSDSSGTGGAAKQREDFQALLRELWEASCMSQGLVGELVCDAHNLAELFSLREQEALGNNLASSRITSIRNGLKLRSAKELAVEAVSISPNRYWKETQANQHLADYLYEIGQLRVTQRSGWLNLKIAPESVSEHSLRAAQMAYLVARISESDDTNGVTPCALAAHLLVHDNTENRTGDPNAVSKRYVEVNEPLVLSHQIAKIGDVGTLG